MLDIKFIKDNKEIVAKAIVDKKRDPIDLDKIIDLYQQRQDLRQQIEDLNSQKNKAAATRDIEAGKLVKENLSVKEQAIREVEQEFMSLMVKIPNIPSPDTPIGPDESGNKVIRTIGDKPKFDFPVKSHIELGRDLNLIDSEKAAEVSGSRFTYLKGDLVLLQFALIQFAFSVLTNKEILASIAAKAGLEVESSPFLPIVPPAMIKPEILNRMARLDPKDDKYFLEKDNLFLAGSAEHTIGPLHLDEIISAERLPIRYVGYSSSFRREAGSYGKDTKGILRMHQFDKLEMETFCLPEDAIAEQNFLVAIQEYLMQSLKLPYQVVMVCTGDMGFPDQRQIDIETWMPGEDVYRETHSSDLIGGFQPRRLNTRIRRPDGKMEHVQMNDATVFAIGRTLIAIMENGQNADGTISIPEVLQSFVGKDIIR